VTLLVLSTKTFDYGKSFFFKILHKIKCTAALRKHIIVQIAKLSPPLFEMFASFEFLLIARTPSRVSDENMPVIIWILDFFIETIYY
jgi:hypothetical protein